MALQLLLFLLLSVIVSPAECSAILWMLRQPFIGANIFWRTIFEKVHLFLVPVTSLDALSLLLIIGKLFASLLFIYAFHFVFVKTLNRVRRLEDVGYIAESYESTKDVCNFIRQLRKVGQVPPVYPNGWFGLIESHRLKVGEAKSINVIGLNLAVFRDEAEQAHAIDAYCPHMGANLAAGGVVEGDCLTCPFHGWRFRGSDGKCTKIPYLAEEKIPEIAKVKSYIVHETNGWIYLWFDAEDREPYWQIPELERINEGAWTYRGRTEHMINSHIEEIPENGADVAHLSQVHGPSLMAGTDLRFIFNKLFAFNKHDWQAEWSPMPEPDGHVGLLKLSVQLSFWGFALPFPNMYVVGRQIGPSIVYLEFTSCFGSGVFIQSLTPVGPMLQKLVHNIYTDWWMPTFIAKIFMVAEAMQLERDLMIWNNKQYLGRPLLVKAKEDSLIGRHRRWYSQFYSEHSPRLETAKQDSLEW